MVRVGAGEAGGVWEVVAGCHRRGLPVVAGKGEGEGLVGELAAEVRWANRWLLAVLPLLSSAALWPPSVSTSTCQ